LIGSLASVFSSNGVVFHQPSRPTVPKSPEKTSAPSSFFSEKSAIVELSGHNPRATEVPEDSKSQSNSSQTESSSETGPKKTELTDEQKQEVKELEQRDQEVRQHEQAHIAAAGGYAKGGPTFEYQKGPDGKQYAVGGEVKIDTSKEKDPQKTIQKAAVIRRAANAPAEPSGQDRAVAAAASQLEAEARRELAAEQKDEAQKSNQASVHHYNATGRGQSLHALGAQFSLVA